MFNNALEVEKFTECMHLHTRLIAWMSCEPAMKYSPLLYAWNCAQNQTEYPLESDLDLSTQIRADFCWKDMTIEQHVHNWNALRYAVVALLDKKLETDPPQVCISILKTLQNFLSTVAIQWEEYRKSRFHYEDGGSAGNEYPVLKDSVDYWRKYWFCKSMQVSQFFISEFCAYGMQIPVFDPAPSALPFESKMDETNML
jgi:hypothetical protein